MQVSATLRLSYPTTPWQICSCNQNLQLVALFAEEIFQVLRTTKITDNHEKFALGKKIFCFQLLINFSRQDETMEGKIYAIFFGITCNH